MPTGANAEREAVVIDAKLALQLSQALDAIGKAFAIDEANQAGLIGVLSKLATRPAATEVTPDPLRQRAARDYDVLRGLLRKDGAPVPRRITRSRLSDKLDGAAASDALEMLYFVDAPPVSADHLILDVAGDNGNGLVFPVSTATESLPLPPRSSAWPSPGWRSTTRRTSCSPSARRCRRSAWPAQRHNQRGPTNMYRYLAKQFADPTSLFLVSPMQLSRWPDAAWPAVQSAPAFGANGSVSILGQLGGPTVVTDNALPDGLLSEIEPGIDLTDPKAFTPPGRDVGPVLWDHLIYSFIIESTGVLEILKRILVKILSGQSLGRISPATRQWARATESLLFGEPARFSISDIQSNLRPDPSIERHRRYYEFFGFTLPAAIQPGPTESADAWKAQIGSPNTTFGERFNQFLNQIWIGYENRLNQVGSNATDPQYVGLLAQTISNMLGNTRLDGNGAREEMYANLVMSWCHLTVEYDSPLVRDLQATATSPEERLAKLGQHVNLEPASCSRELFQLSDPMSAFMWAIELGIFNPNGAPESLYLPTVSGGAPNTLNLEVNRIIDLWQSATGVRIKTPSASIPPLPSAQPPAQPLRTPALHVPHKQVPAAAAATNGHE